MVNSMKFVSAEHEKFYNDNRSICMQGPDFAALVYTIGIDEICRNHFSHIYDFEHNCIFPKVLHEDWQTGSSKSITRLAFNLYSGSVPEGDPIDYCPMYLFWSLDDIHRKGALLALEYFA